MHKRFVINIVSRILLIICFFMIAPLSWALHDNIHSQEVKVFAWTILFGVILSGLFLWVFRIQKDQYEKINAKDGLAIVGLSWILLSAFGALPFFLSGSVASYSDAFFETVSGFTTTGATVISNVEILPRGILFWRSLTHWLGGMGIIVLFLALLPALGISGFQLFRAESPGIAVERIDPRIKETAKSLWIVYVLLSVLETILLMFGGMPLFDSLCHTFGTMATGGFSTKNASIGAYGAYTQWIVIIFMFLAGTNFILHYQALRGKFKAFVKNEEFRYYLFLIIISVSIFTIVLAKGNISANPLRDAAFQVTAILTTTGYATADFDLWPHFLRFALIVLMFIGGCGGSTGGGMKIVRFFLSIKIAVRSIIQTIFPNAVLPLKFNSSACSEKLAVTVASYFIIFISLFFAGTIFLTISENCDIVSAFSASIAALSNIGPGLAKVGATQNYAWISVPGKWMLAFLMLAGRLELYSMLILFLPSTWKK
ncbi:MAG: TrkH family potassium uptake protein [Candidatus Zapsychrus exili]|nr:TrkH family potassium uptake protein [Candidatus Zapsychrus exili]